MASSIGDLGTNTVQSANQNQFLGQTATSNPLLELAQGIMGNAATAQGRGDMAFGGGAGVPVMQSGTTSAGQPYTQVVRKGFTTPGTKHGVTPATGTGTPVIITGGGAKTSTGTQGPGSIFSSALTPAAVQAPATVPTSTSTVPTSQPASQPGPGSMWS
jgi:hypothetical protein